MSQQKILNIQKINFKTAKEYWKYSYGYNEIFTNESNYYIK